MSALVLAFRLGLGAAHRDIKGLPRNRQWWIYASLSLGAWVVAWVLFFELISKLGRGPVVAQIILAVCMAPLHLALNSKVFRDSYRPSLLQAARWVSYWLPTGALNVFVLHELVNRDGLWIFHGLVWIGVSRAVSGFVTTPIDYLAKKHWAFKDCKA